MGEFIEGILSEVNSSQTRKHTFSATLGLSLGTNFTNPVSLLTCQRRHGLKQRKSDGHQGSVKQQTPLDSICGTTSTCSL